MYLQHYGFTTDPFHITPDPRFFYLSASHREAFASMVYGLKKRKGFIAVIGEVGLGKTTVVRSFLQQKSSQTELKTIFIFNPVLSFRGLLHHIYDELEIELPQPRHVESDDTSEIVMHLHQVLIEEYSRGNLIVLVIDEAQNMPLETLENLRMLSNLETTQNKLLQIFLVGQPELERKLNLPELRQLKQRLAIRATLKPLNRKETFHYIEHRLKKAGLRKQTVFTRRALRRIYRYTKGNPRSINILCDNSLVTGFGYGVTRIGPGIIKEVNRDIAGKGRKRGKLAWSAAIAAVFLLAGGGFWYSPYGGSVKNDFLQLRAVSQIRESMASLTNRTDGPQKADSQKDVSPRERAPETESNKADRSGRSRVKHADTPAAKASETTGGGYGLSASLRWNPRTVTPDKPEAGARGADSISYADSVLPREYDGEGRAIREKLVDRIQIFRDLDPVRQKVLVEMAKQTSIRGLMTFDQMLAALENRDFHQAAREMLHSHWGDRAGLHAIKLAEIMYSGHPQGWDSPKLDVLGASGK
jgi:general secretion pathway protein A